MGMSDWRGWADTDLMSARAEIERAHRALKGFDDEWTELPWSVKSALETLQAAVDYLEEMDSRSERKKLTAWNAGEPIKGKA